MAISAVTGLGIVSSLGLSVESFAAAILAGTAGIGDITDITEPTQRVKIGAPVRGFDPTEHFSARERGHLDRFSQFAAVAGRQAWADAGLAGVDLPRHRIGVSIGTSVSGLDILDVGFRRILLKGLRPDPFTVPMTMGNAPTSRIAEEVGARGPSFGINSACASSAHAILLGHKMIQSGMVDVFVAGGTDSSFCDGFLRAWDSLRMLSAEPCRPFSTGRRGMSMGEGSGILVLESLEHARRRGATIRGLLRGGGMSSDGAGILMPDSSGMAAAIRAALDDAGVTPGEIDHVNAHGTGTVANDKAESAALIEVFGERARSIPVTSTKSMIGHCMGASGALEAIATLAALDAQIVPPTINVTQVAEDCPIDPTPNVARPHAMRLATSNSFGFGGLNGVLVFERRPAP